MEKKNLHLYEVLIRISAYIMENPSTENPPLTNKKIKKKTPSLTKFNMRPVYLPAKILE